MSTGWLGIAIVVAFSVVLQIEPDDQRAVDLYDGRRGGDPEESPARKNARDALADLPKPGHSDVSIGSIIKDVLDRPGGAHSSRDAARPKVEGDRAEPGEAAPRADEQAISELHDGRRADGGGPVPAPGRPPMRDLEESKPTRGNL